MNSPPKTPMTEQPIEESPQATSAELTGATEPNLDDERRQGRLEARLAQAEAQIRTLQERMMEVNAIQSSAKQRALWSRVLILIALLGAFFVMQYLKGAG